MSQSIDFYIDITGGQVVAAGSSYLGSTPTLTRNDSYTFRLRLQERDANGLLRDISTGGVAAKLGLGGVDDGPSDGQFKLVLNSITSSAISYNATTTEFYNSISAIAVGATVTTYGNDPYSYLITSATQNTAMSFGGDAFTLFPSSSVLTSTRRFPKANVSAQQIIQLRRNPAVYADTFIPSPTGGVVSITKLQDGGAAKNQSYLLKIGRDAIGGGVVLNYGSNSTTAIPIGASAISFTEAIQSVTGIGFGNISVDEGNNSGDYTISFVKALGNTNLTTGFTLDASGVVFANFIQSTITMATAELDELFAEAGTDSITPTIEIEVTQNGKTSTVYQSTISVRRDLITTGSVVPAAQASYYTKSEADGKFVEDADTGVEGSVDATNKTLVDSSGNAAVDWGARDLLDYSGGATSIEWGNRFMKDASGNRVLNWGNYTLIYGSKIFEWAGGIAFFGVATKSQVTQGSAISALIDYGLLASSTTYGALPLSTKTLMTTAALNFGTLGGGTSVELSVTMTGAKPNDIVQWGVPTSVATGLIFDARVSANDVVALRAFNVDNKNHTAATDTYRLVVIGY